MFKMFLTTICKGIVVNIPPKRVPVVAGKKPMMVFNANRIIANPRIRPLFCSEVNISAISIISATAISTISWRIKRKLFKFIVSID